MNEVKSILVGVDFSECSMVALKHAVWMAERYEATIRVIHVVDYLDVSDLARSMDKEPGELHDQIQHRYVSDLKNWLETNNVTHEVDLLVTVGSPLDEILQEIENRPVDLLILGMSGRSGLAEGASPLGTKCVRRAPTKVVLVRDIHTPPFKRVVACVDFSEISQEVVSQAVRVASAAKADLELLHVFYGPWHKLHYRAPSHEVSPEAQLKYKQTMQSRLEEYLKPLGAQKDGRNVRCQLYESQSQWHGVIEYANLIRADLLVLGTRGRTNLKYVLLGTTGMRVIGHSPSSVLAIKPGE